MSASLSPTTEDVRPSAVIIPFPQRKTPTKAQTKAVTVSNEIDPQTRLANALANLNKALAQQKEAVAKFRDSFSTLASTVQGLQGSLTTYQEKLGEVREKISDINETSVKTIDILKDY
jgi:predicted  nucleic acid-binding Zn-ribbon protein